VLLNRRQPVGLRKLLAVIVQSYWKGNVTLYFDTGSLLWIYYLSDAA